MFCANAARTFSSVVCDSVEESYNYDTMRSIHLNILHMYPSHFSIIISRSPGLEIEKNSKSPCGHFQRKNGCQVKKSSRQLVH